jgi:hypothetical protein
MSPAKRVPGAGKMQTTEQSAIISILLAVVATTAAAADTDEYAIRPERALLRTPSGVVIPAFANDKEKANWNWDKAISDSPGARLPTYAVRSPDDDGKTWTDPVVIARNKKGWTAYPYLFEARPGELWITTRQGGLRARLHEEDFAGK